MADLNNQQKISDDLAVKVARDFKRRQQGNPRFQGLKITGQLKAQAGTKTPNTQNAMPGRSPNLGKSLAQPVPSAGKKPIAQPEDQNENQAPENKFINKPLAAGSNPTEAQTVTGGGQVGRPLEPGMPSDKNSLANISANETLPKEKMGETGKPLAPGTKPNAEKMNPSAEAIKPKPYDQQAIQPEKEQEQARNLSNQKRKTQEEPGETAGAEEKKEDKLKTEAEQKTAGRLMNFEKINDQIKQEGLIAGAKEAVSQITTVGVQVVTAQILAFCWENFYYVIPLIYINGHFIAKYVVGMQSVCEFGEEWTIQRKIAAAASGEAGENPAEELINNGAKWVEFIVLFSLDIFISALLFLLFYAMYMSVSTQLSLVAKAAIVAGNAISAVSNALK